jgi:uncharacterized protein YkwD
MRAVRSAPVARAVVPLLAASLLLVTGIFSGPAQASGLRTGAVEARMCREILVDLNAIRARHGLAPLRLNNELEAAAGQHTTEMLRRGYFSHSSANGAPYWKRIMGFYPVLPGVDWSVGENLLWTPGDVAALRAVELWMGSPEHRRNILAPDWRQIGIAVAIRGDAPGVFEGRPVTVLATDFGSRG